MILKFKSYDKMRNGHICEVHDEDIYPHCIDLKICGDLKNVPDSALVGKTIYVEKLQPYISIGAYCECINPNERTR